MEKYELIVAILASSAFTSFVNQLLNYKKAKSEQVKSKAEANKAEIEASKAEVDLDETLIRHYKIQLSELLIEVQYLREEVKSLKDMLQNRDLDDCQNMECENRKTKRNGK